MASMYEIIMDLPLFKGVGKDQVSQFLEKTPIEIINYKRGDVVMSEDQNVDLLCFILKGKVSIRHEISSLGLKIIEIRGEKTVMGANRLFGIHRQRKYRVMAESDVSIMQFGKESYMDLLGSNRIYLLNFFNYLSALGQRNIEAVMEIKKNDIESKLKLLVSGLTQSGALRIEIEGREENVADFCGCSIERLREWKEKRAIALNYSYSENKIIL